MLVINKIAKDKSIDLWEAWIDEQVIGSGTKTILYVVGEVYASKTTAPKLVKRVYQPQTSELHLDIVGQGSSNQTEEIYFSEVVPYVCPYKEVVFYDDGDVVACIEIEALD